MLASSGTAATTAAARFSAQATAPAQLSEVDVEACAQEVNQIIVLNGLAEVGKVGGQFTMPPPASPPTNRRRRSYHMTSCQKRRWTRSFNNVRLCRTFSRLTSQVTAGELAPADFQTQPKVLDFCRRFQALATKCHDAS